MSEHVTVMDIPTLCARHTFPIAKDPLQSKCEIIHDPIYGSVFLGENTCAAELIRLPEFQRLKHVLQHGITALIGCLPFPPVNRFDHSVGAMILVMKAGGSEEAQLAALLRQSSQIHLVGRTSRRACTQIILTPRQLIVGFRHLHTFIDDVAHTALSHVVDSVFGYVVHEVEKHDYLASTQIPRVLRKYGFDADRVFNEELFPLLELPTPHLCADRLDYGLRDSVSFGYLSLEDAQTIFGSLVTVEGRMALASEHAARLLANAYLASDRNVWADPSQAYIYHLTAEVIKLSLEEGKLEKHHLWTYHDDQLWANLVANASPPAKKLINRINNRCELFATRPDGIPPLGVGKCGLLDDIYTFKLRARTINPAVKTPQGVALLSDLDSEFAERRRMHISSHIEPITYTIRCSTLKT